jgi:hypothetical protein
VSESAFAADTIVARSSIKGIVNETISVIANVPDATYTTDRPVWFAHKDYSNRMAYANTMTYNYGSDSFKVGKVNASKGLGINATTGTGVGLSLYNGATGTAAPTYGIMFALTSQFSTHGSASGAWATYFNHGDGTNYGWIFRQKGTNVCSIGPAGEVISGMAGVNDSRHAVYNDNGKVSLLSSTDRGLYDDTLGKWIIYTRKSDNTTRMPQALNLEEGHLTSATTLYLTSALSTSIIFMKGTSEMGRFRADDGKLALKQELLLDKAI